MGGFILALALAATPVPADLAAAVKAYDAAQVKGDRAALERLLADDYVLANAAGNIETKPQFIAELTAADFHMEPFTVDKPVERVWGTAESGGAVMGGVATLKGNDGGQAFSARLRFADVWAKRGGRWQVIYTQVAKALPGE